MDILESAYIDGFYYKYIIFAKNIVMMIKGIITEDIVDSYIIPNEWKSKISETLNKVISDFRKPSPLNIEMFRGDSFQIIVEKPSSALAIGIALRAVLRVNTPNNLTPWDARYQLASVTSLFRANPF